MPVPEEMSRDELVVLVGEQADRIAAQDARLAAADGQITAMAAGGSVKSANLRNSRSHRNHGNTSTSGRSQTAAGESRYFGKMPPQVVENLLWLYHGDDPIGFSVSQNLKHRHLTTGKKAAVAAQLEPLYAAEVKAQMLVGKRADPGAN